MSERTAASSSNAPIERFDVIVVGGGHAGCEAAITAARLGCSTALFSLNLDRIAWQPCNPAVGGPAKSQLVHEVDALGGVIGRLADATALQKRILNASRGPAVWALRAQTDDLVTALADQVQPQHLASVIRYTDTLGQSQAKNFGLLLQHFFNHQTHHRGQAHAVLTGLGRTAPELDLLYYRSRKLRLFADAARLLSLA
mgnify:CR=1 FL=1